MAKQHILDIYSSTIVRSIISSKGLGRGGGLEKRCAVASLAICFFYDGFSLPVVSCSFYFFLLYS